MANPNSVRGSWDPANVKISIPEVTVDGNDESVHAIGYSSLSHYTSRLLMLHRQLSEKSLRLDNELTLRNALFRERLKRRAELYPFISHPKDLSSFDHSLLSTFEHEDIFKLSYSWENLCANAAEVFKGETHDSLFPDFPAHPDEVYNCLRDADIIPNGVTDETQFLLNQNPQHPRVVEPAGQDANPPDESTEFVIFNETHSQVLKSMEAAANESNMWWLDIIDDCESSGYDEVDATACLSLVDPWCLVYRTTAKQTMKHIKMGMEDWSRLSCLEHEHKSPWPFDCEVSSPEDIQRVKSDLNKRMIDLEHFVKPYKSLAALLLAVQELKKVLLPPELFDALLMRELYELQSLDLRCESFSRRVEAVGSHILEVNLDIYRKSTIALMGNAALTSSELTTGSSINSNGVPARKNETNDPAADSLFGDFGDDGIRRVTLVERIMTTVGPSQVHDALHLCKDPFMAQIMNDIISSNPSFSGFQDLNFDSRLHGEEDLDIETHRLKLCYNDIEEFRSGFILSSEWSSGGRQDAKIVRTPSDLRSFVRAKLTQEFYHLGPNSLAGNAPFARLNLLDNLSLLIRPLGDDHDDSIKPSEASFIKVAEPFVGRSLSSLPSVSDDETTGASVAVSQCTPPPPPPSSAVPKPAPSSTVPKKKQRLRRLTNVKTKAKVVVRKDTSKEGIEEVIPTAKRSTVAVMERPSRKRHSVIAPAKQAEDSVIMTRQRRKASTRHQGK
eukprot:GHVH01003894.1.p1 GENE.GHVH01003894.1~~GHVH01003894.1.p1  ORF type:complete len:736 (-),score=117.27 GHVH01003894.1:485-2671(-)